MATSGPPPTPDDNLMPTGGAINELPSPPEDALLPSSPQGSTARPPIASPTSKDPTNGVLMANSRSTVIADNVDTSQFSNPPDGENTVIADSLRAFLPDTQVRLLSIGDLVVSSPTTGGNRGRRYSYRLLQTDTDIVYEANMSIDCDDVECSDADVRAAAAYDAMVEVMNKAVSDGSLTMAVQEKAMEENVPSLANIEITGFSAEEPIVEVFEGEAGGGGGTSPSSRVGGFTAVVGTCAFAGLAFVILFM